MRFLYNLAFDLLKLELNLRNACRVKVYNFNAILIEVTTTFPAAPIFVIQRVINTSLYMEASERNRVNVDYI